ncbi:quinon protein alcohol dehydrogenase-like superfamily [Pilobolus umbonatus]|nr:quinon protein alcohol dehydrogenase-like superfamily [Pilobolus umbonatus]
MKCTKNSYCYRHTPELMNSKRDEFDSVQLQQQLSSFPVNHQKAIASIWSVFQQADEEQRLLILKGMLSSACTPQLSYLSSAIPPLLSTDFTLVFPSEIVNKIFTYLDASSLCAAAQVNAHWKKLADNDSLWHRMCEQHINKKCVKCGWGLPLLQKRKVVRVMKRGREESDLDVSNKRVDRRPWKDVYSERLIVERNWRRNKTTYTMFKGQHKSGISSLQFCEAQNILITASYDKTAIVWNLETGEILRTLKGHARCIRTLQFDDTKLVTGSMDHTLRIWNYHTGQCIRALEGHTDGVVHLNFTSRILASGSADSTIKIWNFQTGECYTLAGHTQSVNHVNVHKDSSSLVSCSDDGSIRIWDLEKRVCSRVLKGHMAPVQTAIPSMPGFYHTFSAKAPLQISNSSNSDDEDVAVVVRSRRSSSQSDSSSDCNASSQPVVISGSLDNTIKIWSLQSGECLQTLFGHVQGIWSLAYDKLRMVSGSNDGTLKVWDIESGLPMYTLDGHHSAITAVSISDTKVVSANDKGEVHVWNYGPHV